MILTKDKFTKCSLCKAPYTSSKEKSIPRGNIIEITYLCGKTLDLHTFDKSTDVVEKNPCKTNQDKKD
jgi:hypothetical protein